MKTRGTIESELAILRTNADELTAFTEQSLAYRGGHYGQRTT